MNIAVMFSLKAYLTDFIRDSQTLLPEKREKAEEAAVKKVDKQQQMLLATTRHRVQRCLIKCLERPSLTNQKSVKSRSK